MEKIIVSEFKATCLRVLDQVYKTGRPVIITKRGAPIALVSPPPLPEKTGNWLGAGRGSVKIVGDIVSPVLPESDWEVLK